LPGKVVQKYIEKNHSFKQRIAMARAWAADQKPAEVAALKS
jgi:hypothetical protein